MAKSNTSSPVVSVFARVHSIAPDAVGDVVAFTFIVTRGTVTLPITHLRDVYVSARSSAAVGFVS